DLDRLVRMMQGLRPAEDEFDERIKNDVSLIYKGLMRSFDVSKPIIAAVKGYCVAGGMEMLQATDIRVAAEDARVAIAEVKHGLFPMGGSTARLARQIPFANAMEILLTGEQFSAADAEAGLQGPVRRSGHGDTARARSRDGRRAHRLGVSGAAPRAVRRTQQAGARQRARPLALRRQPDAARSRRVVGAAPLAHATGRVRLRRRRRAR